jgi:flavorubredoxin
MSTDTDPHILYSSADHECLAFCSLVEAEPGECVRDFDAHVAHMEAFHRFYMVANRACRLWANMVKTLDVEMIVPQHGHPFKGREMIARFLDWISQLACGVDLITPADYRVP